MSEGWQPPTVPRTLAMGDETAARAPRFATGDVVAQRYHLVRLLGEGGMGEVYEAVDRELGLHVALKILRAAGARDERARERFRRELALARRITDRHVCRLFDLGVHAGASGEDGLLFLTMELVAGGTLRAWCAAGSRSWREVLHRFQQAGEGLAAAHEAGLVHRDFKPENVLLTADGEVRVADFGLVGIHEVTGGEPVADISLDVTATHTGSLIGTPAYMAPEQHQRLVAGPAADQFAFCAALWEALHGTRPFAGDTYAALAANVVAGHVVAPDPDRDVPAWLRETVRRGLRPKPEDRWPSMSALLVALRHDPGAVRRRRGRTAAVVGSAAILLVALAAVATLWSRSTDRTRATARRAQQFGEEARAIESLMRVAHLLPAHDIRADRAKVRARMDAVEAAMKDVGAAAEGPGHHALGRGAMALGDRAAARGHLERAWARGDRSPEVAYALGQVLGEQYEAALMEAAGVEIPEEREAMRRDAVISLRDPALVYLRAGRGAQTDAPALVEGLIAYREGRYEDALAQLAEAQRAVPSLYEAQRLTGDIYTDQARTRREQGDVDGAIELAARAADAYRDAAEIGRSDPTIQVSECERRFERIVLDWDRGQALDRSADDALAACERALVIDPDNVDAYREEAVILWRVSVVEARQGKDPRPTLARAVARAEEGLRRDPRDPRTLTALGTAWLTQAQYYEMRRGIDARPSLRRAIDAFERSIAIRPTSHALVDLGAAHSALADLEVSRGGDPEPEWALAADGYLRAIALTPGYSDAYVDLGTVFGSRAGHELSRGRDPSRWVDEAIAAHRKAIELKPDNPVAWLNLGAAWWFRAVWDRAQGNESTEAGDQQIAAYRKVLELKPDYVYAYDNLADAWHLRALRQVDRGLDPSREIDEGRTMLVAGRKLDPNDAYSYQFGAQLEVVAARSGLRTRDADARLADADVAIARALELDPESADCHVIAAEIQRWRAERRRMRGASTTAEISRGLAAADRALAINPTLATAVAVRSALLALAGKPTEARVARARALELNPLLARDYPAIP